MAKLPRTRDEFAALFWSRVDMSGDCWEWKGRKNWRGYGQITSRFFTTIQAHRIAYQLAVGPVPSGMLCCHTCDNRGCVNPDHLFVGTDKDNVADMLAKGRSRRDGQRNPGAKLSEDQVGAIRVMLAKGIEFSLIARCCRVHPNTIQSIALGKTWRESGMSTPVSQSSAALREPPAPIPPRAVRGVRGQGWRGSPGIAASGMAVR